MLSPDDIASLGERVGRSAAALAEAVEHGDEEVAAASVAWALGNVEPSYVDEVRCLPRATWDRASALLGDDHRVLERLLVRVGLRPIRAGLFRPGAASNGRSLVTGVRVQTSALERHDLAPPPDLADLLPEIRNAVHGSHPGSDAELELLLARVSHLKPTYEYDRCALLSSFASEMVLVDRFRGAVVAEWLGYEALVFQSVGRRRRDWPPASHRVDLRVVFESGESSVLTALAGSAGGGAVAIWALQPSGLILPRGPFALRARVESEAAFVVPAGAGALVELATSVLDGAMSEDV